MQCSAAVNSSRDHATRCKNNATVSGVIPYSPKPYLIRVCTAHARIYRLNTNPDKIVMRVKL